MASQRLSPPCGRPRSRLCGRTSPAQATFPCCFPPLRRAHTPAGCGHGGTRKSNTSRSVHTWSVRPAAIAGVRGRHCVAEPLPWVGSGWGNGRRTLAWGTQKLEETGYTTNCCCTLRKAKKLEHAYLRRVTKQP